MEDLDAFHAAHASTTVPLQLCGDISHGLADAEGKVIHDNWSLFEMEIPWMREFHFKNTDAIFNSTFGFGPEESEEGIVDLAPPEAPHRRRTPPASRAAKSRGILRSPGPSSGREYADRHLERMLVESLQALKAVFTEGESTS